MSEINKIAIELANKYGIEVYPKDGYIMPLNGICEEMGVLSFANKPQEQRKEPTQIERLQLLSNQMDNITGIHLIGCFEIINNSEQDEFYKDEDMDILRDIIKKGLQRFIKQQKNKQ